MRVDDYILKTVVFVGVEGDGLFTPMGTGFLVAVKEADLYGIYLVTAAHVVEQINSDHIFVRINKTKGSTDGCVTVKVPTKNIRRHNDPRNDIAVFPFPFDKSVTDHMPIAMGSDHLGNSRAEIWEPGIGDEVAAVGLYTSHYGETRNRPVVRIGNIAAMPGEPVKTGRGYVNAYLVEVRSIAGLSGSPVFLNVPHFRMKDGQMQTLTNPIYQPIGILVGYHIIESREDQITVPRDQNFVPAATEFVGMPELNTGFGVVIPIERLIDILEKDDEKARRKSAAATHFANAGYVQTVR